MGKYAMYQVSEDNVRKYGKLGTGRSPIFLLFGFSLSFLLFLLSINEVF